MENHTIVTLKKGEGRTIKAGGAWIFDNEIDTCLLYTSICRYMGVSLLKFHSIISPAFELLYYSLNTLIHVRLFVNYKLISYKNCKIRGRNVS